MIASGATANLGTINLSGPLVNDGTLLASQSTSILPTGSGGVFTNAGVFEVPPPTYDALFNIYFPADVTIGVPFSNSTGTVSVGTSGALYVADGGSSGGNFTLADGSAARRGKP